jgi:methionyl-tRNA formyltransferase
MLKIGIIGQKWLAEGVFKELSKTHQIVFTAAPHEDDRLARAAIGAGIELFVYGKKGLRDCRPAEELDLLIAAHAFVHIPAPVRETARWAIGYHPSLLPLYRGMGAVEAAIAAGDKVTGGTVFHLEEEFDAGPIAFQERCFIEPGETPAALWRRALAPMGLRLLVQAAAHLSYYDRD